MVYWISLLLKLTVPTQWVTLANFGYPV